MLAAHHSARLSLIMESKKSGTLDSKLHDKEKAQGEFFSVYEVD